MREGEITNFRWTIPGERTRACFNILPW